MAETTADAIFQGAGGGGKQSANGDYVDPSEILPFYNGIVGSGAKADRYRLGEDPFVKAAEEAKKTAKEALETAKDLKTTTQESGTQTTSGVQQTTFDSRSREEQQLLDASIENYGKQQALVDQQTEDIQARSGVQTAARSGLTSILGGDAFNLSAGEQANIDRLRQANIDVGSNAVNELLTQRLGEVSADAARRGVRGQAFSQLQGDALGEAAKSLERTTLDANRLASQQAIDMPATRVGIQAGTAGQFAGFQDELQQQAIQNRQALQDPVAMQALLDERLKGGKTTTGGTTSTDGTSTKTGLGQEEIIAGMAGITGKSGAKTAGGMGILNTVFGAMGGGGRGTPSPDPGGGGAGGTSDPNGFG